MTTATAPTWAEVRASGIGSSDAAAVCGLSNFATALDVWMEKTGRWVNEEETFAQWVGKVLEPGILRRYAKEAGLTILGRTEDGEPTYYHRDGSLSGVSKTAHVLLLETLRDPKAPWRMAHIDGFIVDGGDAPPIAPIEAKSTSMIDGWGDEDDEIPPDYLIQVHHQLAVLSANGYDFDHVIAPAALIRKRKFHPYRIERNDLLIKRLVKKEDRFWKEYVETDMPPPPEYNARGAAALAKLYAKDDGEVLEADEDLAGLVNAYHCTKFDLKRVEDHKGELEARLKEAIGAASTLSGSLPGGGDFKIHWKRSKDRTVTDWEAAFKELRNVIALAGSDILRDADEIAKQHTTTKPGVRSFRYYGPKEKKDE